MDWKMHLLVGAIAGAAVSQLLGIGIADSLVFAAVSGASSLLPDLDTRKSKASKIAHAAAFAGLSLGAAWLAAKEGRGWADAAICALLLCACALAADFLFRPRHRGAMHGLLFLLALAAAAFFLFGWFVAAAISAGYFSHLLADGCFHL